MSRFGVATRVKSKSWVRGVGKRVVVALVILIDCYGLTAIGDNLSNKAARVAAGGDYSLNTSVRLTLKNSLPVTIDVQGVVSRESDWNGTKPSDSTAFGSRSIEAGASHGADLVSATTRSQVLFTLTFATEVRCNMDICRHPYPWEVKFLPFLEKFGASWRVHRQSGEKAASEIFPDLFINNRRDDWNTHANRSDGFLSSGYSCPLHVD